MSALLIGGANGCSADNTAENELASETDSSEEALSDEALELTPNGKITPNVTEFQCTYDHHEGYRDIQRFRLYWLPLPASPHGPGGVKLTAVSVNPETHAALNPASTTYVRFYIGPVNEPHPRVAQLKADRLKLGFSKIFDLTPLHLSLTPGMEFQASISNPAAVILMPANKCVATTTYPFK